MSETITVTIRSKNKLSGDNNNYNVLVPFRRLNKYKKIQLRSSFYLLGGDYTDFESSGTGYFKNLCEVRISFPNTNHDTNEISKYGLTLGIGERVDITTTESILKFNVSDSLVHIIDFPTEENISVQILTVNDQVTGNKFFTTTNVATDDDDCTENILVLEITGIE